MPTISVIVPIYNTEQYLHRCIDSILAQTFTDYELLLVDDGSKDASGEICDDYAKKDSRVRVFHQENQGQAAARNHALDWVFANSVSKYISFVDSDDWVHPRYLELLYAANERFGTNISQCLHIETDGTVKALPMEERITLITAEEQYTDWYSAFFWDKLFRTRVWENTRFPEGQIYEDVAIWYKMLFSEERIGLVKEVLYYYFINPSGTVRSDWTLAKLKQVDAWEDQIVFFTTYGNKNLLDCAAMHLFQILRSQLIRVSRSEAISWPQKKKYECMLKQKLRRAILRFYKTPYYKQKKLLILESAFPRVMWFYWTAIGVKNKVSRTLGKREG